MTIVELVVMDVTEGEDSPKTIEQAAENFKQSVIAEYYSQTGANPSSPPEHDRITITGGVVTITE